MFYDSYPTDRTSFGVSKLKRRLHRFVLVYSCQNATLLEISCRSSYKRHKLSQMLQIIFNAVHLGFQVLEFSNHFLGASRCRSDVPQNLHVQVVWSLNIHVFRETYGYLQNKNKINMRGSRGEGGVTPPP